MESIQEGDEASIEREKQRTESEARDIIHDVQRLYTTPEEKKTRWIWELLQNAKDVTKPEGINITINLTKEKLEFSHDGKPFETKHLLAILYKTSTKSLDGDSGTTTGKYGTGFVTTHVLNKKLTINGVHSNLNGKRRFSMSIDRSAAIMDESFALLAMQDSLSQTFADIQAIGKMDSEDVNGAINSFHYNLTPDTYVYAEKGLNELKRNSAFTLLINESIKKIEVVTPQWSKSFSLYTEKTDFSNINFASTDSNLGLFYQKSEKLIFAVPTKKVDDKHILLPLANQAVLYKEFPLIGTENFNLPVYLQHNDFHPTELRDGIRTKITNKEEPDPIATKNRNALSEFVDYYLKFIEQLLPNIKNAHLLAMSGLPEEVNRFANVEWFVEKIQSPIREYLLSKEIVTTVSGSKAQIKAAKFILLDSENRDDFFDLASIVIPDKLPEKDSIWHWSQIIKQDLGKWPEEIEFEIDELVKLVDKRITLAEDESFEWLKKLYGFLTESALIHLGDNNPIYPTEGGHFKAKDDGLSIHPMIDNEFKIIAKGLGRDLNEEFLNRKVGQVDGIKAFELTEFYNDLNKNLISELKVETASVDEIKAILRVCCLFKSDRVTKRDQWYQTISQLLPKFVIDKKIIVTDYENYYRSADLWSVKYVCYLIEKSETPLAFSEDYFEGHSESFYEWYNQFLKYVFSMYEDSKEVILKKDIIPVQTNEFKPYDDYIYAESDSKFFDDTIKDISKEYTSYGDPRKNIVDTKINNSDIREKGISAITKEIDSLFHQDDIDLEVRPEKKYNNLFLSLCAWIDQHHDLPNECLTKFKERRPYLNIIALGEGFSKQMIEIKNSGKSLDDIKELAKIKLTADEMRLFESAADELGIDQLISKAQEMILAKKQIERWKSIGKAAEIAFREALSSVEPEFEILNPDIGKDFVIIANGKEYAIEIKSVDPFKSNVNMSLLQGKTAVLEKHAYSLSVLSRPENDEPVTALYFKDNARFVMDIGTQIGDSIDNWSQGLQELNLDKEVKVTLDNKIESVYISRNIWKDAIPFLEFIDKLNNFFKDENDR
jgi:hypothetical protein